MRRLGAHIASPYSQRRTGGAGGRDVHWAVTNALHTVSGTLSAGGSGSRAPSCGPSMRHRSVRQQHPDGGRRGLQPQPRARHLQALDHQRAGGYPDQAYGPDGTFANATIVDLTRPTRRPTSSWPPPLPPTPCRDPVRRRLGGRGRLRVGLRCGHRSVRQQHPTGPAGPTASSLVPDTYKFWITNGPALSRPGLRPRRHLCQRHHRRPDHDRPDGQYRHGRAPATNTVSGPCPPAARGRGRPRVGLRCGHRSVRQQHPDGGRRGLQPEPRARHLQARSPTGRGYPDQAYGPDGTFANATIDD